MADSSSLHNGTIPLVAEIGGARRNPSIRLRPNCWAAGRDVLTSPGWGSPPNKCLLFPESKCAKKFQVKCMFKSSTGCRHLEVALGLLSEMSCFLTRCQHFRRCKVCFFLFFCGLERYLTMILASWHNKVLTDNTREWFCYPTPKLVTAVGSSGYLHPRKLRWIPRLWSGKGDSF